MKVRQPQHSSQLVIGALLVVILSGFTLLGTELWQLQVREQDGFETLFRNQSIRRVRLPAVRGKIFDAKDRVLADSIPNFLIVTAIIIIIIIISIISICNNISLEVVTIVVV